MLKEKDSRMNDTVEWINDLEDRIREITQPEEQTGIKKQNKTKKQKQKKKSKQYKRPMT